VYHTAKTVFHRLEDEGIDVPEDDRYYPYRATYDIEVMYNNQGLLKLTNYFESLNSLTFGILFFRCQLYVFYSYVDKCLSSKVDAEQKTIIFNVLLNSKEIC
jgi:hypothetical protein